MKQVVDSDNWNELLDLDYWDQTSIVHLSNTLWSSSFSIMLRWTTWLVSDYLSTVRLLILTGLKVLWTAWFIELRRTTDYWVKKLVWLDSDYWGELLVIVCLDELLFRLLRQTTESEINYSTQSIDINCLIWWSDCWSHNDKQVLNSIKSDYWLLRWTTWFRLLSFTAWFILLKQTTGLKVLTQTAWFILLRWTTWIRLLRQTTGLKVLT